MLNDYLHQPRSHNRNGANAETSDTDKNFWREIVQPSKSSLSQLNLRRLAIHLERDISKLGEDLRYRYAYRDRIEHFSQDVMSLLQEYRNHNTIESFEVTRSERLSDYVTVVDISVKPVRAVESIIINIEIPTR